LLAFVFVLSALTLLGLWWLMRKPFGRVLVAVRENELRTQLLGYDVRRHKLVAFVLGGAIAGLGGALYAAWGNFINPSVFSLSQAALVAIWVLVGGRRSLIGAFAGVILVQKLTSELGGSGGSATPIVLGGVMIAVVVLLPEGLVPTFIAGVRRLVPALRTGPRAWPEPDQRAAAELPSEDARPGATLETIELGRTFGGVVALDGVSLSFEPGVHCLIGPNGAGKSTFFNLLVGRYRPSSGRALLDGSPLDRWRPDERARRGVGIKLQVPSLYGNLRVAENLWLAAYGHLRNTDEATQRAIEVLRRLGLAERSQDLAGEVAHGEQQWIDIGMVLAQAPRLILLDEPTAGMTQEETRRTVDLVTTLGKEASVVVVEHDMRFVRDIKAPVTVFHQGRVFAQGSIEDLRQDPRLLDIYLGRTVGAAN
jgi:branched-chain amino acid transport system permease protein